MAGFLELASGSAIISVAIKATDEFTSTLESFKKKTGELSSGIGLSTLAIGAAFTTAGFAIADFVTSSINEFIGAQQVMQRAHFQFGENAEQVIAVSKEMSQTSIATTKDIIIGFTEANLRLHDLGIGFAQQQQLVTTAMNLSAASGNDFNSVLTSLASGVQGSTRGLREYGIVLEKGATSAEIFNAIIEKGTEYQNASADAMDTAAGKVAKLKEMYGDFLEGAGALIYTGITTEPPEITAINKQLTAYRQVLTFFSGLINGPAPLREVEEQVKDLGDGFTEFSAGIDDTSVYVEELTRAMTTIHEETRSTNPDVQLLTQAYKDQAEATTVLTERDKFFLKAKLDEINAHLTNADAIDQESAKLEKQLDIYHKMISVMEGRGGGYGGSKTISENTKSGGGVLVEGEYGKGGTVTMTTQASEGVSYQEGGNTHQAFSLVSPHTPQAPPPSKKHKDAVLLIANGETHEFDPQDNISLTASRTGGTGGAPNVTINVNGAGDPYTIARMIALEVRRELATGA